MSLVRLAVATPLLIGSEVAPGPLGNTLFNLGAKVAGSSLRR